MAGKFDIDLNIRVFRRNRKNIILVWDSIDESLDAKVWIIEEGQENRELKFTKFTPDSPEKFNKYVGGSVISHSDNDIDPTKDVHLLVKVGDSQKEVSVNGITTEFMCVKMFAYCPSKKKYFPVEGEFENGRFKILTTNKA